MAWLMWQMSGLGPMAGQYYYFTKVAPEDMPLAKKRYLDEIERLFGVMDGRLAEVPYLAGADYTIADIACFPGVAWVGNLGISIDKYPHVKAWREKICRPSRRYQSHEIARSVISTRKIVIYSPDVIPAASIRLRVMSCFGCAKISSVSPCSMILP